MILTILYYAILLVHLFPVVYILLLRSPEYAFYFRSSAVGKAVVSVELVLFIHVLYQLFVGDLFSTSTIVMILEIAVMGALARFSNAGLNPMFKDSSADLTGKLILVTGKCKLIPFW